MRRKQNGLSLIELLVASAIGLLLLLGVTNIVINSSRAHKEVSAMGQQLENGRYALQTLTDDLKHAGYYGHLFDGLPSYNQASLPDPCADSSTDLVTLEDHLLLAVQGYDGTNGVSCLDNANYLAGTDILVVRRAQTTTIGISSLVQGEVYLQSLPRDRIINAGSGDTVTDEDRFRLIRQDGVTPADIRKYRIDIYYVSPCSVPASSGTCDANADGGRPIPTLKRMMLSHSGGTTQMISEPLVEGIQDLQIDWGIDQNEDGAPNIYRSEPADLDEWQNVVAAHVYVLARNIQPTPGYTDQKTYSLGQSGTRTFGDDYKRHLYSGVVRLMNISTRRETS